MTPRVIDLPRIRVALDALDAHVHAHPELTEGDAPERLAASLEGVASDLTDEPPSGLGRRRERPASRGE